MKQDLTREEVLSLLIYDPQTGIFVWKQRSIDKFPNSRIGNSWNARYAGKIAGSLNKAGYIQIVIGYRLYYAHRLAWLIMEGEWPQFEIDHEDTDEANNCWNNLRVASSSQNKFNQKAQKRSKSGIKGLTWATREKMWRATIGAYGKHIHIGYFTLKEDAISALKIARLELHGEYSRAA